MRVCERVCDSCGKGRERRSRGVPVRAMGSREILRRYRALLCRYRALLCTYRALLCVSRALLEVFL